MPRDRLAELWDCVIEDECSYSRNQVSILRAPGSRDDTE